MALKLEENPLEIIDKHFKTLPFFKYFSSEKISKIISCLKIETISPEQIIFHKGCLYDRMIILYDGMVEVKDGNLTYFTGLLIQGTYVFLREKNEKEVYPMTISSIKECTIYSCPMSLLTELKQEIERELEENKKKSIYLFLSIHKMFRACSEDELSYYCTFIEEKNIKSDTLIIEQDRITDGVYVIVSGKCEILYDSSDGGMCNKNEIIATVSDGTVLGAMNVLKLLQLTGIKTDYELIHDRYKEPHFYTARTVTPCIVGFIKDKDFVLNISNDVFKRMDRIIKNDYKWVESCKNVEVKSSLCSDKPEIDRVFKVKPVKHYVRLDKIGRSKSVNENILRENSELMKENSNIRNLVTPPVDNNYGITCETKDNKKQPNLHEWDEEAEVTYSKTEKEKCNELPRFGKQYKTLLPDDSMVDTPWLHHLSRYNLPWVSPFMFNVKRPPKQRGAIRLSSIPKRYRIDMIFDLFKSFFPEELLTYSDYWNLKPIYNVNDRSEIVTLYIICRNEKESQQLYNYHIRNKLKFERTSLVIKLCDPVDAKHEYDEYKKKVNAILKKERKMKAKPHLPPTNIHFKSYADRYKALHGRKVYCRNYIQLCAGVPIPEDIDDKDLYNFK